MCARYVFKAFHGGLARITARRCEDEDFTALGLFFFSCRQEMRKYGERQIFKGRRAAVKEFRNAYVRIKGAQGHNGLSTKSLPIIGSIRHGLQICS